MQEDSLKTTVKQWLIPIFVLLAVIIIIVINFTIKSRKALSDLYELSNKQIGESYCENIESDFAAIASISDNMRTMVVTDDDEIVDYLADVVETLAGFQDIYMAAYCRESGNAILPDGSNKNLKYTSYFELLKGEDNFFAHTFDDGITGQAAFLYICPVEGENRIKGYLITYIESTVLERMLAQEDYGNNAYYAIVDKQGNVLAAYGNTQDPTLVQSDFWNELRSMAKDSKNLAVFDNQRATNVIGVLHIVSGVEERTIYSLPIDNTEWSFVLGLNGEYVMKNLDTVWAPAKELIIGISVSIALFIIVTFVVNFLFRIRANEQNKKLKSEADTDLLTGLSNKIATERMIKEYMSTHPSGQSVMFVVDLDNFKKINDTKGHAFGDEVLRVLGMRLQSMFRSTDIIGRIGGDEFIVFLKDIDDLNIIEREGRKLEQLFYKLEVGEYVKYSVTGSVGGAVFPSDGANFEALYKAADKALYASKQRGKRQLTFHHQLGK